MNEKNGTEILIAAQDVPLELIEAYPEATDHVAKELELKLSETIFTRLHDGGTYAISVQAIKRDMAPTNSIRFERNLGSMSRQTSLLLLLDIQSYYLKNSSCHSKHLLL